MTTEVLVAAACALYEEEQKEKHPLAYRLGYEAYTIGIKKGHNPFRVDCVNEWLQWRQGWEASFDKSTQSMSALSSGLPSVVLSRQPCV